MGQWLSLVCYTSCFELQMDYAYFVFFIETKRSVKLLYYISGKFH